MELLFLLVVVTALLIAHEAAHAAVAWRVGATVPRISIGIGPRVAGFRLWSTLVEFRVIPGFGYCDIRDDERLHPSQRLGIALAGSAANLVLGVVLLAPLWISAGASLPEAVASAVKAALMVPMLAHPDGSLSGILPPLPDTVVGVAAIIGVISAFAGWVNLVPLAPLDGWVALMETVRWAGLRPEPRRVERMARVSSAVLIGAVGLAIGGSLPAHGGDFVAFAVVAGVLSLVYLMRRRS
jgi:membrane-associated protease RseP (regulator of RpoE activity)